MILGHTIALDPTPDQARHFRRACGTKRYAFNWGLAGWQRMDKAGEKPSMPVIKSRWNTYCKAEVCRQVSWVKPPTETVLTFEHI